MTPKVLQLYVISCVSNYAAGILEQGERRKSMDGSVMQQSVIRDLK